MAGFVVPPAAYLFQQVMQEAIPSHQAASSSDFTGCVLRAAFLSSVLLFVDFTVVIGGCPLLFPIQDRASVPRKNESLFVILVHLSGQGPTLTHILFPNLPLHGPCMRNFTH